MEFVVSNSSPIYYYEQILDIAIGSNFCHTGDIYNLCLFWNSQVEDVLFAAGEALSFIWGGLAVTADLILKSNYTSLSLSSNFLIGDVPLSLTRHDSTEGSEVDDDSRIMVRDVITKKLFDVLLYSNRKEERCAGTVWLLSLTMYCGHHPKIQQLLPEIQVCCWLWSAFLFNSTFFHHLLHFYIETIILSSYIS